MAIEQTSYLYEALIRFGPDGFVAAHQVSMARYVNTDTGEVISESERPAEPVSADAITTLIGNEAVAMAAQITAQTARISQLETELTAAREASDAAPGEGA